MSKNTTVITKDQGKIHNQYLAEKATSQLEFSTNISVFGKTRNFASTQIICTVGPSCKNPEILEKLFKSGMNVARMNFSHGDHKYHKEIIDMVREISKKFHPSPIAIALDTKGPEIRTGNNLDGKDIFLDKNDKVILTTNEKYMNSCTKDIIYIDYKSLVKSCTINQRILLADGNVLLNVDKITFDNCVECSVISGFLFGSKKNCSLPGVSTDLPAISEKDRNDLKFAVDHDVDFIFASFIRSRQNLIEMKNVLSSYGSINKIKIIAKIENFEGVNNIDDIIDEADGIMVARGDLGMDIPLAKVILAQKMIIAKCNKLGKPVICATQMMESMVSNVRPTRAEISDIGNAVIDGADCVMLSGETANGKHPNEAVLEMTEVCKESEEIIFYNNVFQTMMNSCEEDTISECIAMGASCVSFKSHADAIIVLSTSGKTAKLISKYRPRCPIIVVTRDAKVARQCLLYKGLFPFIYEKPFQGSWEKDVDYRLSFGIVEAKKMGIILVDSKVVFVCGWQKGPGYSNTLRILNIGSDDILRGMKKSMSEAKLEDLAQE